MICEHGFSHDGNHTCDDCCLKDKTIYNDKWVIADRKRVAAMSAKKTEEEIIEFLDNLLVEDDWGRVSIYHLDKQAIFEKIRERKNER